MIEFECPFCNRLLRTPEELAGKQAECPGCGEMVFIPYRSETAEAAEAEAEPGGSGVVDERHWFDRLADLEARQPPAESPAPAPENLAETKDLRRNRPCPMCGGEVGVEASHCPHCGERLQPARAGRRESFRPVYGGFWLRFGAWFIDGMILGIPMLGVIVVAALLLPPGPWINRIAALPDAVFELIGWVIIWPYFALMESSRLQGTLGKLTLGLQVTDMWGNRVSFGKATGRHFGKILSGACFALGYIVCAFDDRKQAWHDSISGCLVIRRPPDDVF